MNDTPAEQPKVDHFILSTEGYIALRRYLGQRPHDEVRDIAAFLDQLPAVTEADVQARVDQAEQIAIKDEQIAIKDEQIAARYAELDSLEESYRLQEAAYTEQQDEILALRENVLSKDGRFGVVTQLISTLKSPLVTLELFCEDAAVQPGVRKAVDKLAQLHQTLTIAERVHNSLLERQQEAHPSTADGSEHPLDPPGAEPVVSPTLYDEAVLLDDTLNHDGTLDADLDALAECALEPNVAGVESDHVEPPGADMEFPRVGEIAVDERSAQFDPDGTMPPAIQQGRPIHVESNGQTGGVTAGEVVLQSGVKTGKVRLQTEDEAGNMRVIAEHDPDDPDSPSIEEVEQMRKDLGLVLHGHPDGPPPDDLEKPDQESA